MKLHKEGNLIITASLFIFIAIISSIIFFIPLCFFSKILISFPFAIILFLIIFFFRKPKRNVIEINDNIIYAPADGKVVVIEKTFVDEFLKEDRLQVSIFMSPLNVHINWMPISGVVKYFKYHCGNYAFAWHPKASCLNERTSTVVETNSGVTILIRQIAGALARRIVTYTKEKDNFIQGNEFGFIKFGSRVDLFLPLNSNIKVNLNQKVSGNKTIIALLK